MKAKVKPHRKHLNSSDDLVTSHLRFEGHSAALALERKRRSEPFIGEARALRIAASGSTTPKELVRVKEIQGAVLIASGLSREESLRLRPNGRAVAARRFIDTFLRPAGPGCVEELVSRFLSARNYALDIAMRDAGQVLAQRKLSRYIIATLALASTPYRWLDSINNLWGKKPRNDFGIELFLRGLSWSKDGRRRTVIFNMTVPFLKNNVDVCLFDSGPEDVSTVYTSPAAYVALGELKGGIDPAGADEHWKTAKSALDRIRRAFERYERKPHTFFVGAAVAKKMAGEIWGELEAGTLENAANLTDGDQVASLSRWLCNL